MTSKSVRGVTLVELLVAMALAGIVSAMVFGWMRHASKVSHASQLRDDREQQLSMLRDALFQDGTLGRLLSVRKDAIEFTRRRDTLVDTVRWTVSDTGMVRGERAMAPAEKVESWQIVPRIPGMDPLEDPWVHLDKDLDGAVDPEALGGLESVEIRLVVLHRDFPAMDRMVSDTFRLVAPARGPG